MERSLQLDTMDLQVVRKTTTRVTLILCLGALAAILGAAPRAGMGAVEAEIYDSALALPEAAGDVGVAQVSSTHYAYAPFVAGSVYSPPQPSHFGVQLYRTINEETVALSLMRKGQSYWARWPVSWARMEPNNTTPDNYDWAYDASILNAHKSGIELIVTVNTNPTWAAVYRNGPIDRVPLSEFAEFMVAMAERYDGDGYQDAPGSPVVNYFELYNEPDAGVEMNAALGHSYWGPFGDQYAAMLCAIYQPMKTANPNVQVVLGGIAYDAFMDNQGNGVFVREFLGDIFAAGGGPCFDVMNFHYYPPFESAWAPYGPGLSGKANYLRNNYPLSDKAMVVTESGWHSENYSNFPSSPTLQARYVIELFTQAKRSNIMALTWWTWIDPGGGYGPNGLLDGGLQPKIAFEAFRDAAGRIGRATLEAQVNVGSNAVQAYRLRSPAGRVFYVMWADDDAPHWVNLPLGQGDVIDMYGNPMSTIQDGNDGKRDGWITVWVDANPIYVEASE